MYVYVYEKKSTLFPVSYLTAKLFLDKLRPSQLSNL